MDSHLHVRLRNCLQTILDLESDMDALEGYSNFRADMETLKGCLDRVGQMQLIEEDVLRLESATAHILDELRFPLARLRQGRRHNRVLQ